MKKIVMLVGNVGSGKSTLAKKLVKQEYVVISRDALRYGFGVGGYIFNKNYEGIVSKTVYFMFKEFLSLGVSLVIDETNMTKSIRKRYITKAKKNNYKIVAVILPKLTKEVALDRRMKNPHTINDREYWAQVWQMFNDMYEEPSFVEGFNHIINIAEK